LQPLIEPESGRIAHHHGDGACASLAADSRRSGAGMIADAMPKPEPAPGRKHWRKKNSKIAKRGRAVIDPGHETPARHHAKTRLESALNKVFPAAKDKAVDEAQRLIQKVAKAEDEKKLGAVSRMKSTLLLSLILLLSLPRLVQLWSKRLYRASTMRGCKSKSRTPISFADRARKAAEYAAERAAEWWV